MMRAFGKQCLSFAVVTAVVSFSAAASASELFVMPFACSAPGGQPMLTPSADQGYAVIGRKEQRPFSACSRANPDVCKQWTVYRFDINCNGKRVPWVDVAAAISATRNGRAFSDHGRLRIEMPPRWAMSPGDPCLRDAETGGSWRGEGFGRFCAERQAHARGPIVEIPDGFAPMMGLDAIFVADGGASGKFAGPSPLASAEPRPAPFASEPEARPAKPNLHLKPSQAPSDSAEDAVPAPKPVERAEKPENKSQAAKSAPVEAAKSQPPAPSAENTTLPAGTPLMPTVINKPNAPKLPEKPAEPAAAMPEATPAPVPAPKPAAPPQPSHVVTASIDAPATGTPNTAVTEVSSDAPLRSSAGSALTPTVLAGAGVAALALVALMMMQWQNRSGLLTNGARDIATVSFDSRSTAKDLVVARAPGAAVPAPPPDIFAPRDVGSDMPQTRQQAFQMLGMGIASEDNAAAIKKIVDGLRQSWHPDHAGSEADRQLRELRTKQINAAWAIINGGSARADGTTSGDASRQLPPNAA